MSPEPQTDSLLPTRQSLLSRLRDWQDQEGWREFFDTYWRLVYNVARKSGLGDSQAQEVVQSTFIYLARKMPKFRYEPGRGSFKSWLRVVTRSRISVYRRSEKPAGHSYENRSPARKTTPHPRWSKCQTPPPTRWTNCGSASGKTIS